MKKVIYSENNAAYCVEELLYYGKDKGLITELDAIFVRNRLFELLKIEEPTGADFKNRYKPDIHSILEKLLDYSVKVGIIEDSITQKDLFDTKIMGLLTPMPSTVKNEFYAIEKEKGSKAATDYFYKLSKDVNYIRTDRISKNKHWIALTEYGEIEVTINLSKPEKDPLLLKMNLNTVSTDYPKCVLCIENMGFEGNMKRAARENHRLIPLELGGENWYLQYSPYVYYNEHCIVIFENHKPMHVFRKTFERLFQFLDRFPHYFIGSNTDLPIVGGSILEHEHYQGGCYDMPMVNAGISDYYDAEDYEDVSIGILNWPLSSIRLSSKDKKKIIDIAEKILDNWRKYDDEAVGIFHETLENEEMTPHNTVTPISRINKNGEHELDIVLRNNRTSEEYPRGIFHPHPDLHHIKKENIGLIEVMGLAILPGRLETETFLISEYLTGKKDRSNLDLMNENDPLFKHKDWISEMMNNTEKLSEEEAMNEIKEEIGKKFTKVLENAGVYKNNIEGQLGFGRFMKSCGFIKKA
jgi:UDPglucose--hexose-1-phosphate uridylyltransferase